MKKPILFSLSIITIVAILYSFASSKSAKPMRVKMHIKDLPHHGLKLIDPSDPSFDERIRRELKDKSDEVIEAIRPYSVFLENTTGRTVVAYVVQWRFTRTDGTNQYYRKAFMNPEALMLGETPTAAAKYQSGRIEANSSQFLSLLSPDGSGMLQATLTPSEAEAVRNGTLRFDRGMLLRRFSEEAAQYSDVTVSVDGAFFDDGTFVGPDTTNFFSHTKAAIDAKRDLLQGIRSDVSNNKRSRAEIYKHLDETVRQEVDSLDAESSPAEYYKHFTAMYAKDILRLKTTHGEDKALTIAVLPLNRPWPTLTKKDD